MHQKSSTFTFLFPQVVLPEWDNYFVSFFLLIEYNESSVLDTIWRAVVEIVNSIPHSRTALQLNPNLQRNCQLRGRNCIPDKRRCISPWFWCRCNSLWKSSRFVLITAGSGYRILERMLLRSLRKIRKWERKWLPVSAWNLFQKAFFN